MKSFFILATALATVTPLVAADGGTFINNCPVPVYARSATCQDTGHDATIVGPGETYEHNLSSTGSNCNRAIKIATSVEGLDSDCYNVEWVVDDAGELWYNLSHDHGNPVQEFARTMTVEGCDDIVRCEKGDDSCDYPVLKNCKKPQGVTAQSDGSVQGHGVVRFNLC